jgi:hypothetical protein
MVSANHFAHFSEWQFRNTQDDQIVFFLQIRNMKVIIDCQAYWHVGAVMPHARQHRLNHKLVPGMATGHKNQTARAPSRRKSWLPALCVVTRRKALSVEQRKCFGKGTCCIASVRCLMGKVS